MQSDMFSPNEILAWSHPSVGRIWSYNFRPHTARDLRRNGECHLRRSLVKHEFVFTGRKRRDLLPDLEPCLAAACRFDAGVGHSAQHDVKVAGVVDGTVRLDADGRSGRDGCRRCRRGSSVFVAFDLRRCNVCDLSR